MPVQFNVLLLLDAGHGCLAEIEALPEDTNAGGGSRWLWIEANWVTTLQHIGEGRSTIRVFDCAVLTLTDSGGELRWPSGRCERLALDPTRTLRPAFRRLLHQHLN